MLQGVWYTVSLVVSQAAFQLCLLLPYPSIGITHKILSLLTTKRSYNSNFRYNYIIRYFIITWPEKGENEQQKKSLIRSYLTVIIIWIYSGIIASMPLFGVGKYVPEGYLTSCSFDYLSNDWPTRIFILVFFIMAWIVPISIIIASYSTVLRFVTQNPNILRQERANEVTPESVGEEQSHNRRERRNNFPALISSNFCRS